MIDFTQFSYYTLIFCATVTLFNILLRKSLLYEKAAKFPGPAPSLPLIGHAYYLIGSTTDATNTVMKWLSTYSSPFTFRLGSHVLFVVSEPEQLKTIFQSPKTIEKPYIYNFFVPWLGHGLFNAPTDIWRAHRKLIAPTFNTKILESFVETFAKHSEIMVKEMRKELGSEEFDIFHYVSLYALDTVCETVMGVTAQAQLERDNRYEDSAKKAFQTICQRIFKVWYHPDFIFKFSQLCREQNECVAYLHNVTNDIIQRKKDECKRIDSQSADHHFEASTTKKTFLDLLMELADNGEKFTQKELCDEVNTIMTAGNDTTATSNTFILYMLANYPDVQEKAYEELREIFGDQVSSSRPIQSKHLNRMIYLERVIKETLRLFPVVPMFLRHLRQDIDIDGGHTLPKGGTVMLAVVRVHRLENIWPDPLKFDPDRFLPEQVAKRHPYSYVPFSAGPRNCIGFKYAMMSMKVVVATVLRRYVLIKDDKFSSIEDVKIKSEISLKPVVPLKFRIVERLTFK